MLKRRTFGLIMALIFILLFAQGGNVMANANIQMAQRNSADTEWDNSCPVTKASNVKTQDGLDVETKLADNATLIVDLQTNKSDITALTAGSTTGDAELIDARIGKVGLKFINGTLWNGQFLDESYYRVATRGYNKFSYDVVIGANTGFLYFIAYKDPNGTVTDEFGNKVTQYCGSGSYTIPAGREFRMMIKRSTENKSEIADVSTFVAQLNIFTTADSVKKQDVADFNVRKSDYQERHPIISFVSDDGIISDYNILKPLSVKYGVPFTSAIITSLIGKSATDAGTGGHAHMTAAQMQELQNTYGWEMASHTDSHRVLSNLTYDEIETEMTKSQNILNGYGLRCNTIVYPQGGNNASVREIARKYYRSGVIVQDGSGKVKLNKGVVPSYYIVRNNLGSYFDKNLPGIPATNTYEYYKYLVDQAIANNAWLVFELHTGNPEFDATQQKYLDNLIAYIKTTNATIATVNEGLNVFGNYLESGDFLGAWNQTGCAVNKLGEVQQRPVVDLTTKEITNDYSITKFPFNKTSTYAITDTDGVAHGFPTMFGTLEVRYYRGNDWGVQLWYPINQDKIYMRRSKANGTWNPWTVQ